ncbi:MAG: hypothetical protein KHX42_04405 [Prevotella sp.]|nr:hypothetical protein [Prevotella sp.]
MVQLKKKVTIKTKIPQEETPAEVKPVVTQKPEEPNVNVPPETPPTKKSKNWIWIVLVLSAVVLFLCYKSCDKSPATESSNDQTTTTQVEGNNDSVVVDGNESEVTPSNETDDNADENVASESELKDEDTVDEKQATEPQTTTAPNNSVQQNNASSVSISGTLEEKAKAVIRGNYGNGLERKQKLGEEYAEIQGKVNEMYRNGLVK